MTEPCDCEEPEFYRLIKDVPMIKKRVYSFLPMTGEVYATTSGERWTHPLRPGIAGYLWLLRTEPGYMRRVRS